MEDPYLGQGKKNAKIWRAWIVFLDESGISERPPVRRTWAPRGRTPILRHPFNWKKLSICSAIGYRWDGQASRLYFRVIAGSYNDEKLISFLLELKKQLPGRLGHVDLGREDRLAGASAEGPRSRP